MSSYTGKKKGHPTPARRGGPCPEPIGYESRLGADRADAYDPFGSSRPEARAWLEARTPRLGARTSPEQSGATPPKLVAPTPTGIGDKSRLDASRTDAYDPFVSSLVANAIRQGVRETPGSGRALSFHLPGAPATRPEGNRAAVGTRGAVPTRK